LLADVAGRIAPGTHAADIMLQQLFELSGLLKESHPPCPFSCKCSLFFSMFATARDRHAPTLTQNYAGASDFTWAVYAPLSHVARPKGIHGMLTTMYHFPNNPPALFFGCQKSFLTKKVDSSGCFLQDSALSNRHKQVAHRLDARTSTTQRRHFITAYDCNALDVVTVPGV